MDIVPFMDNGIFENVKRAGRFYFWSKRGRTFIKDLSKSLKINKKIRQKYTDENLHIPPFLIASITSSCNLHCAGCYAHANKMAANQDNSDMASFEWRAIFEEAQALGISFILLAGGEPLIRKDVLLEAALLEKIIFPVFTNGTLFTESYLPLFDKSRNLIPVLSLEGDQALTDSRRGEGIFTKIQAAMALCKKAGLLYGVSITITKENMSLVIENDFIISLIGLGCGLVFFVEYVPIENGTEHLALNEEECVAFQLKVENLRSRFKKMLFISFPGDEAKMGGCLAAGRGFFHINAHGGAEPCPFSPYSQYNLKEHTIKDVLQSGYFARLREINAHSPHTGGCSLFNRQEEVQNLLSLDT